ncbi:hypothetical protein SNEBB_006031, partial [Seison nebaliae]
DSTNNRTCKYATVIPVARNEPPPQRQTRAQQGKITKRQPSRAAKRNGKKKNGTTIDKTVSKSQPAKIIKYPPPTTDTKIQQAIQDNQSSSLFNARR